MKILDANLLLYAVNRDAELHERARAWLDEVLAGDERVGLPWPVILAFLRIATSARALPRPLTAEQALDVVGRWLAVPTVRPIAPGEDHWLLLRELLHATGTGGSLVTDAHLAAIAIAHGAELCSADTDFARFPRLKWTNPLA